MPRYLKDNTFHDGSTYGAVSFSASLIRQVLQATKTDTQTISAGAWTDLTSLSVAITPSDSAHKILIFAQVHCAAAGSGSAYGGLNLVRDSTSIFQGAAASNRTQATGGFQSYNTTGTTMGTIYYLDSPSTTSEVTYKIQAFDTGGTVYINTNSTDADAAATVRGASSIIVMEVGT